LMRLITRERVILSNLSKTLIPQVPKSLLRRSRAQQSYGAADKAISFSVVA